MSKLTRKVTIAADLARDVFEIAVANASWKVFERRRMTRAQFARFWQTREPCRVVIEACSGAHHWARYLTALGFEVDPLPAHYVAPYRQRNKTDRADCDALLEAAGSPRIQPVAIKSEDQQAILALPPRQRAVEGYPHHAHQWHAWAAEGVRHHRTEGSPEVPRPPAAAPGAPS